MRPSITEEKAKSQLERLGFNTAEWKTWRGKWTSLSRNAKSRGCKFQLTFNQYLTLAKKAGIKSPKKIGRNLDKFQMGRIGDSGDYVVGNCRFISMKQNLLERSLNGGIASMVAKKTGRTAETHEYVRRTADQKRGRTAATHEDVARSALKRSKKYRIISPLGIVYKGTNLREFCRKHNLNQAAMSGVCRLIYNHYKGWKGRYV